MEKLQKEKDDLLDNVGILTSKLSDASMLVEELEERCVSNSFHIFRYF